MKRVLSCVLALLLALGAMGFGEPVKAAGKKLVDITYDDGPSDYTGELLDGLKERGVKATFFLVGRRIPKYQEIANRIYAEGHQVGNHSYSHEDLAKISLPEVKRQIRDTNALLDKVCGKGTDYMVRPPYGSINPAAQETVNLPCIFWSTAPKDWIYTDAASIKKRILESVKPGDIILVHDTVPGTVQGTLQAIDAMRSRGYEFVTVRELFRRQGLKAENGKGYGWERLIGSSRDPGPVPSPKISYKVEPGGLRVTLSGSSGAPMYYTVDGSPINQNSRRYRGPFTVTGPCTIRACCAYNLNGSRSDVVEKVITTATALPPVLKVWGGMLEIEPGTPGSTAYYTLTGAQESGPDIPYEEPVPIEPGTVISAFAQGEGFFPSRVERLVYSPLGNQFRDVFPTDWYFDQVDRAVAEGIMLGTGQNRFEPKMKVTRGQLVTFLFRSSPESGMGLYTSESSPFSDVPLGKYYTEAVEWAKENDIVSGYQDGFFRPNKQVSRQELAVIFSRYLRYQGAAVQPGSAKGYTDASSIGGWAKEAVEAMTALGLLQGDNEGAFRPRAGATRAEAAAVLLRVEDYLSE